MRIGRPPGRLLALIAIMLLATNAAQAGGIAGEDACGIRND